MTKILKFNEFIRESMRVNSVKLNESLENLKNEKVYWGIKKKNGRYFMMFGKDKDMYLYDKKSIHTYNPNQFDELAATCVQHGINFFLGSQEDGTYVLCDNSTNKPVQTKEEVEKLTKLMNTVFPHWEKTSFKGYIGPYGKHMFVSKTYFDCYLDKETKECFIGISDETQLNNNTYFGNDKSKKLMKKTGYILKPVDFAECVFIIFKEKDNPIKTEEELKEIKSKITTNFPNWKHANLFKDMF